MSYHRPMRITVEDAEIINEMPSNSSSSSNYSTDWSSNIESSHSNHTSNHSSFYNKEPLNISPLSAMSYSPQRRVPTANRIAQIANIVTDVLPFQTNEDNLSLPTHFSENSTINSSVNSHESMQRFNLHCCFINFVNIFIFSLFSILNKTKLNSRNPNDISWSFYAITPYPECKDTRSEIWRLISYSFVHADITHLLGNAIGVMATTLNLNRLQKFSSITIVYFICIINGALSHYLTNPYMGVIGASGGVFGLAGSNISAIIYDYDSLSPQEIVYFYFFKGLFIMIDLISYKFMYSDKIAYQTHWYCYLFGILTGFIFYDYKVKKKYKDNIRFASLFLFCYINSLLLYHYVFDYPTEYSFNYFKITKENNCCYESLHFHSIDNSTFKCTN